MGDITCDGTTDENDNAKADLNRDGMVNFLDDFNGDGVIDSTDQELGETVAAAAAAGRNELDKGGSFSRAKSKAYEAVKRRGASSRQAKMAARIGTVKAVGDRVSDGVAPRT